MFHYRDDIFFGRLENGDVRIVKSAQPLKKFPEVGDSFPVLFDLTIDANSWCSIIASVSSEGEECGRFYAAKEFHG